MPDSLFRAAGLLGVVAALTVSVLAGCRTLPGHGALTTYSVTLRYFGNRDSSTIMRVMAGEFPGYESHRLVGEADNVQRYQYRTTAKAFKLEEWLSILLRDMGFDVDREIEIQLQGNDLLVDQRALRSSDPPARDREWTRPRGDRSWVPVTGERFR